MIPSALLFIAISSLFACLCSFLHGSLTPAISLVSLLVALGYCIFDVRARKLSLAGPKTSTLTKVLYALIIGGIYAHSVFLFYLKDDHFWWIQNVSNLGDLSFHWGTIRNLAKGASFWPENPIFLGHRFRYPFGMDFFNSLFESLGVDIGTHLPLVTLGTLLLTMYALHVAGGPLLVFAIFFSAGFYNFMAVPSWNLPQVQETLDFKNLFLTVLITQRGFVYALPAGLYLYVCLKKFFAGSWTPNLVEKISLGIIWGGLGFFHLHSFFLVSLYLGLLILWKKGLKTWLPTLVIAVVLGLPFVVNALWPEAGTTSLIHWSRGWNRAEGVNYFLYWLKNLGPWLVLMVLAMVEDYRAKNWQRLVPTGLAFLLFALFAHLILAPWDWDNIKLILWCYVFGLLAIQDYVWNKRPAWFQAAAFAVFCVPGLLLFVHSLPASTRGTTWANDRDLNKATVLLKNQNVNQGLLVGPEFDHPALLLGYKLYMGYPGHVWSHGYSYGDREGLLNRYFDGEADGVSGLPKDQFGLIYQSPLEKRREKPAFSTKGLSKVGEALDHELYRIE
jgi:hypothetical protein